MRGQKYEALEFLRGVSAFYVCLHHVVMADYRSVFGGWSFLFSFGQEAVMVFFVLSGFVIFLSYERAADKSFKTFFVKRLLRIYPIYIFSMLLTWAAVSLHQGYLAGIDLAQFFGNILMMQDVSSLKPGVYVDVFMGNSPLWSLGYEWWFYMLFIPLLMLSERVALASLLGIFILASVIYVFTDWHVFRVLSYMSIWWLGIEIAKDFLSSGRVGFGLERSRAAIFAVFLIFLVVMAAAFYKAQLKPWVSVGVSPLLEARHFGFVFFSVAAFFLFDRQMALLWERIKDFRAIRFFVWLSTISYAIYVFHWPILIIPDYPAWALPLMLGGLFLVSWFFEVRFTKKIKRLESYLLAIGVREKLAVVQKERPYQ